MHVKLRLMGDAEEVARVATALKLEVENESEDTPIARVKGWQRRYAGGPPRA